MNNLTLGSLFDGSGGFPLGGLISGITPLWASEIEPFPIRVTTRRLPNIKHLGDISTVKGSDIEPVDIITFGSPCTDMSVAGKRAGLDGKQSVLFYQAIRIVKEMREATNGKYPRFIVWENVPGAFSSNKGEDFKAVLEAVCSAKGESVFVPKPPKGKWSNAGSIVGEALSVAWRVFDAQFWGVPQRRKRIYLVADFAGGSAGKILFEPESLPRNIEPSRLPWQGTAAAVKESFGTTGRVCLNDQGGQRMDVTEGVTCTLRAEAHHPPIVMDAAGFCTEHSSKSRGIGYEKETSPTLRVGTVPAAVMFENHSQDTRYAEIKNIAPTVLFNYGTGGNNQPFVVETTDCFDVRFTSEGTKIARQNCYKTETSRTIDTGGNAPDSNQGGIAVVAVQGSVIGRDDKNGPQGSGVNEDVSFTLNTTDRHAVAYGIDRAGFNQGKNAKYDFAIKDEVEPTITAKGLGAVAQPTGFSGKTPFFYNAENEELEYIVRRLTPTECARLQGFPDWWCSGLETEEPTEADLTFWREVFETYRKIMGKSKKSKTDKQIIKWLKAPHSDSAEYKMWGNGVALPNVIFVLSGIVRSVHGNCEVIE